MCSKDRVDILTSNVRKLGYERPRQRSAAGILDPAEVAGRHVEKSEVRLSLVVGRVDYHVKEDKERSDRNSGHDAAWVPGVRDRDRLCKGAKTYQTWVYGSTSMRDVSSSTALALSSVLFWHDERVARADWSPDVGRYQRLVRQRVKRMLW